MVEHPDNMLSCVTCQKVAVVENCALTAENERLRDILSLRDSDLAHFEAEVSALKAQLREGRSHTRHTYPDFAHRHLRGELEQDETERWNTGWRARAKEGSEDE